jgi:hypothetical protein
MDDRVVLEELTEQFIDAFRQGSWKLLEPSFSYLDGATVDVVISNCVINLSVDKPAVLTEIARVLQRGTRIGRRSAAVDLTIVVSPRLTLARTRLQPAQTGRLYQARITALGGVGKTTFTLLTGRLSAGIHPNPSTGTLSGKPGNPAHTDRVRGTRRARCRPAGVSF